MRPNTTNLDLQSLQTNAGWKRDVAVVLLVSAACMGMSAHAPSNTYAFAQLRQIGATIGSLNSGNWVLPRTQEDRVARKGPMYAWLLAPVLAATGIYDDVVFRAPTIVGTFITAILVYLLGRRWFGRWEGLWAGCLWGSMLHLAKLSYIATTDMLLTTWFTGSIYCLDRVLFHRGSRCHRTGWIAGLWLTIIGGALTKGWGLANIVPIGLAMLLATGMRHGFAVLRCVKSPFGKLGLLVRVVARRWWRAIRATHAIGGILLVLVVLVTLFIAMAGAGGQDFRDTLYREVWQRFTGEGGVSAPPPSAAPPILTLLYYTVPASLFALYALALVRPRRWSWKNPLSLPLSWILGLVIPYSFSHGFRPDYLLPCYGAVALMGGWAIEQVQRRGPAGGNVVRVVRHLIAAVPLAIGLALILFASVFLFQIPVPKSMGKLFGEVETVRPESWWLLWAAVVTAAAMMAMAVRASLRWNIRAVAAASVVVMLCMLFLDGHFMSRHAKTADGDHMAQFGREARKIVGSDEFAVYRMEKLCTEIYIGRFGSRIEYPASIPAGVSEVNGRTPPELFRPLEALNAFPGRWLMTCDRGLLELGVGVPDANGEVILEIEKARNVSGEKFRYRVRPEELGRVRVISDPVRSQRWGKMYLIELAPRPLRPTGGPVSTGFVGGTAEE